MAFGRRILPDLINFSNWDWTATREQLHRFLESLQDSEDNGLPAGGGDGATSEVVLDNSTSNTGDSGDPGTGWVPLDHTHHLKRDVRVKYDGTEVSTRNAIDFRSTGGAPSDDSGNDEINVPIASPDSVDEALAPGLPGLQWHRQISSR